VEAFSKYVEVIPMPDAEADTVAYCFLHHVLARFAAPGQVVSDAGTEFLGGFQQLLEDCLIDHRTISVDHPQANGQAEKVVHIVKNALMKMISARHSTRHWDTDAAWLALGYRCSPHSSTGFTPYELMFARPPVVPPAVKSTLTPLDLDSPELAAKDLLQRKELLQQHCPMALENLSIAQHRDQQRYLKVRAPDYKPRVHRFRPGEFVYVQQLQRASKLQPRARPVIYRILAVKDTGVLDLQGRCGATVSMHMSHCAPCHLPDIDGSIDPLLLKFDEQAACEECGSDENEGELLLCDVCNLAHHTYCLNPPLVGMPTGYWLCAECVSQGYTEHDAEQREQQRQQIQQREQQPNIFPNAQMKRRDQAALQLHGRLVQREFTDTRSKQTRMYWGRLHFMGAEQRPYYFRAVYDDGDSHDVTVAGVKRYLLPEGTQLPAGVTIPTPADLVAASAVRSRQLHWQPQQQQQLTSSSRNGQVVAVQAVQVPAADIRLLQQTVRLSRIQALTDPVTFSTQWQSVFSRSRCPVSNSAVGHGATAVVIAPVRQGVLQAVHAALQQHPVVLLCYVPTLWLPVGLHTLTQALKQQNRAVAVRGQHGWWIIISRKGINVDTWLH
jgi:hypothetical protein